MITLSNALALGVTVFARLPIHEGVRDELISERD